MAPGELPLNRKALPNCAFLNLGFLLLSLKTSLVRFQAPRTAFESLHKLCLKLKKIKCTLQRSLGMLFFFFFNIWKQSSIAIHVFIPPPDVNLEIVFAF